MEEAAQVTVANASHGRRATACSNGQPKVTLTLKVGSNTVSVTDCGQKTATATAPTCPGPDCVPPITEAGYVMLSAYGTTFTYDNFVVTDTP